MKRKILIVDDEAHVRLALRTRLTQFNCEILEAPDLRSAEDVLSQHRSSIGLVILDLRLVSAEEQEGDESGLQLLRGHLGTTVACVDCGRLCLSPKVIILTAHPSVTSCRAAFRDGAFDFLDKDDPGVWEKLLEQVPAVLADLQDSDLWQAREWVEEQFDELTAAYAGQTVAVKGQEVVAAGETVERVRSELEANGVRPDDCLIVIVPALEDAEEEQGDG